MYTTTCTFIQAPLDMHDAVIDIIDAFGAPQECLVTTLQDMYTCYIHVLTF